MSRAQQDLEQATRDVTYELQNLVGSLRANEWIAREMTKSTSRGTDSWKILSNSTQEAFLLHYRNLKQFLNNLKYDSDVKAEHFSDSWQSTSSVVGEKDEDDRLNRRLAHISYDRKSLAKDWDYRAMEDRICDVFDRFLKQLKPQCKSHFDGCEQLLALRRGRPCLGPVSNRTDTARTFSVELFGTFGTPFPVE